MKRSLNLLFMAIIAVTLTAAAVELAPDSGYQPVPAHPVKTYQLYTQEEVDSIVDAKTKVVVNTTKSVVDPVLDAVNVDGLSQSAKDAILVLLTTLVGLITRAIERRRLIKKYSHNESN